MPLAAVLAFCVFGVLFMVFEFDQRSGGEIFRTQFSKESSPRTPEGVPAQPPYQAHSQAGPERAQASGRPFGTLPWETQARTDCLIDG